MRTEFVRQAIDLAIENVSAGRGGPFGAVIAKDGVAIATGTNCVISTNDPTAHAEMVAIREACRTTGTFKLTGCDIYTNSEPCPMCLGAIYWARLERVYYAANAGDAAAAGFDDLRIYQELKKTPDQRSIRFETILRQEALEAFRLWKQKGDRIEY